MANNSKTGHDRDEETQRNHLHEFNVVETEINSLIKLISITSDTRDLQGGDDCKVIFGFWNLLISSLCSEFEKKMADRKETDRGFYILVIFWNGEKCPAIWLSIENSRKV